jgi:hypothetical protein
MPNSKTAEQIIKERPPGLECGLKWKHKVINDREKILLAFNHLCSPFSSLLCIVHSSEAGF